MSILYMDGFEQYSASTDLLLPYAANTASTIWSFQADTPFGRGQSIQRLQPSTNHNGLTRSLGKTVANGKWCGQSGWFKWTAFPYAQGYGYLFGFLEGSSVHSHLGIGSDGALYPARAYTDLGPSTSRVLGLDKWHHIEVKTLVNDAPNGIIEVKVDGETWGYWDGLDTRTGGNGTVTAVRALAVNSTNNNRDGIVLFDSWAVWDEDGDANNDWIGSVEVYTRRPSADGSLGSWTPNTGDAYAALSEQGSDGDTTYISSGTLSDAATFDLTALAETPTRVLAVQSTVVARKDDSGPRAIRHGVTINSADGMSGDEELGIDYSNRHRVIEKNPDTGANWTPADLELIQSKVVVSA